MTKTVLLTGGFGNLGGRFASLLSNDPDFDLRLGTHTNREVPHWAPRAQIAKFDVTDPSSFGTSFAEVDTVIHLVGLSDIDSAEHPELANLITVNGTNNVLKASIAHGVRRFIYFSTAHVYGAPLVGQLDESTITRPTHPYATTHLAAEKLVFEAHQQRRIEGVSIRCANSFGRPMEYNVGDWKTVVGDLCRQLVFDNTLILQSNGLQERNFVTRADVCAAVQHFLSIDSGKLGDGVFNVGSTNSSSVMKMALAVQARGKQLFGAAVDISTPPNSQQIDEIPSLNFSIERLISTGFSPTNDFATEIDGLLLMLTDVHGGRHE
jgi:UDP-glucose 4-epimerase